MTFTLFSGIKSLVELCCTLLWYTDNFAWEYWFVFQQRPFSTLLIPAGFLLNSTDQVSLRSGSKENFASRSLPCKITLSFKADCMLSATSGSCTGNQTWKQTPAPWLSEQTAQVMATPALTVTFTVCIIHVLKVPWRCWNTQCFIRHVVTQMSLIVRIYVHKPHVARHVFV